jgi:hypothetical protein
VAHCEGDNKVVLDCVRERKPRFVPAIVVAEFAEVLARYGVHEVFGDRVGGGFHSDEWARNGGTFRPSPNDTSENYLRALPMMLAGRVRLLDNATLRRQLSSLERHVLAGREVVKHPQLASAHDDVATAVCGALVMAVRLSRRWQERLAYAASSGTRGASFKLIFSVSAALVRSKTRLPNSQNSRYR